jgi:hypothetical protein
VAVVQYTFTHKKYTEYREQNIHNNKKNLPSNLGTQLSKAIQFCILQMDSGYGLFQTSNKEHQIKKNKQKKKRKSQTNHSQKKEQIYVN